MTPDPNFVVEALRVVERQAQSSSPADIMRSLLAKVTKQALPHAEAIAAMWDWTMPQAVAIQELIAAARDLSKWWNNGMDDGQEDIDRLRAALKPFEEDYA